MGKPGLRLKRKKKLPLSGQLCDEDWNNFLIYVRYRLQNEDEFGHSPNELAMACQLPWDFWELLEERWRQSPQKDFDYEKGHDMIVFKKTVQS